jgi:lauroyl/myristoyl acyltransferase
MDLPMRKRALKAGAPGGNSRRAKRGGEVHPIRDAVLDGLEYQEARLFEYAERIADEIKIAPAVLEFLRRNSRWQQLPRQQWERHVRVACAIDQISGRYFKTHQAEKLQRLVDLPAAAERFETLKSPRGLLLLTFHGAFVIFARRLFAALAPDGHIMAKSKTVSSDDARGALFAALRKLQDGGALLVAPDGPHGKQTGKLGVFGKDSPAAEGPAYLAYASGCDIAWYTIVRERERFVPIIEPFPGRKTGEGLTAFRDRLCDFCSSQIETMFSGDPRNIVLRGRWSRIFAE